MLRHWAAAGTSPWAGGFDAVNHGGSILAAIKAAGGDGWFPTHTDIDARSVAEARALGLKIGAWTVDEPAEMRRLIALGLDAICTDRRTCLRRCEHRASTRIEVALILWVGNIVVRKKFMTQLFDQRDHDGQCDKERIERDVPHPQKACRKRRGPCSRGN